MFYRNEIKGSILQGNRIYTYQDLRDNINLIKNILYSTQCMRNKPIIALALPRTIELIAAIIASLECRITFLPLDISQPKERIDYMLDFAEVTYILSSSKVQFDFGSRNIVITENFESNYQACEFVDNEYNEVAYLLYTSGTTGRAKAVEITRKGFNNFLEAIPLIIDFNHNHIMACFTNCTFDIFFLESVLTLYQGLTVVLADEEEQNNPKKMAALLMDHKVDMIQMTPSRLKMLRTIDHEFNCLKGIKIMMIGGEALPYALFSEIKKKTNARIYNMYGPTETTIWSSLSDLTNKDRIDIGKPIKETTIFLLNEDLELVPDGQIGEICIGGSGLAKGYLNNRELTDKSFIRLAFEPFERIYKTGDLGIIEEGELICLGRKDQQIKLRGHRIELEDIDSNMLRIKDIEASVTCFDTESERLITFYVSDEAITVNNLRERLQELLPQYMIPNSFCRVEHIILTASGKVDRRAMLQNWNEMNKERQINSQITETSGDQVTDIVIQIAKGVMEDQSLQVAEESSLAELGMDSINYMNMIVHIESNFNLEIEEEKLVIKRFEGIKEIVTYVKHRVAS